MKRKMMKGIIIVFLSLAITGVILVLGLDRYVKKKSDKRIISETQAARLEDIDCILVLGCKVREDGSPSHMLRDRLAKSVELYNAGISEKLLMSGDHGREEYNEVGAMKQYAMDAGIFSDDIFMDHAGFSTYESIYRAKEIYGAERIIIVTQEYHLYRALYIADALGIEAYGVAADDRTYSGQAVREAREILARAKDCVIALFKPEPTYLGESISLEGNGNITND